MPDVKAITTTDITAVAIRRSFEESTVAIIHARCDISKVSSPSDLRQAVKDAVRAWVKNGDGRDLLNENSGDINIGDLAALGTADLSSDSDPTADALLREALQANGVLAMRVETYVCDDSSWEFDDNLARE